MRERHAALDPEVRIGQDRAWYVANRERLNAEKATRRLADPEWAEAERQRARDYYEAHPERFLLYSARRRARLNHAGAELVNPLVVLERSDGICGIGGFDVDPTNFHVDHVTPISRGGLHVYSNVQAAHPTCNLRKSARLMEELA
jgi:5-methylcytosine-specific restriction endonuclease McrA